MMNNTEDRDLSPIVFYYFFDFSNAEAFCRLLSRRFRESGHKREIEFRCWNCYHEEPDRNGDLFCYDALVLSALVANNVIRELPDIIDTGNIFPWLLDRSRIQNKIYGIPIMACASVVICREEDYLPIRNVYELPEGTTAPLKSLIMSYYLFALINFQHRKDEILKSLRHLKKTIGEEIYEQSHLSVYDGSERFNNGEYQYLIGFSEDVKKLNPGQYIIQQLNFSDSPVNEMPMFFVDLISIGSNVSGEKLLDCLDLIKIMADSSFIYDFCTTDGQLQYMLPADRSVYPQLIALDPIYKQFLELVSHEDNGILRYGKDFYPSFPQKEQELLEILNAEELK